MKKGYIRDLTDQRFGKLVAKKYVGFRIVGKKTHLTLWECVCDCGNTKIVSSSNLVQGVTKSCGCIAKKAGGDAVKRGEVRLYRIWSSIRSRTGVKKGAKEGTLRIYANRGITMCNEWKESYLSFRDWALNNGYNDTLVIDRKNNEMGYSPDNCRWVSAIDNVNNRRKTLRLPDGKPLATFCKEIGVPMRSNGVESSTYAGIAYRFKRKILRRDLQDYAEKSEKLDYLLSICKDYEAL